MFEIIEQLGRTIRLPISEDIEVSPGHIISLLYGDGVCCILSNSRNPFGMVAGPIDNHGLVPVLYDTAILKTSNFDKDEDYNPGDFLYSSDNGTLTSRKCKDDSLLLGQVLDCPSDDKEYIEINWI